MQLVTQKKRTLLVYLATLKKAPNERILWKSLSCTTCSLMKGEPASHPLMAWVISSKYLPSEPAEECTHVMSCADITGE